MIIEHRRSEGNPPQLWLRRSYRSRTTHKPCRRSSPVRDQRLPAEPSMSMG